MTVLEIIAGGLLIISCIGIIIVVTVQMPKSGGISSAIMGGDSGGANARGRSRNNDAKLAQLTKVFAVVFFIVTFAVNLIVLIANRGTA